MRTLSLFSVSLILLLGLGCSSNGTATPAREKAELNVVKYYEANNANKDRLFAAQEKALLIAKDDKIDLELQVSIQQVQALAKADPVKYPAADLAAEISQLYQIANSKKQRALEAANRFHAIKDHNDATNLAGARKIVEALKPPTLPPPVDSAPDIYDATGKVPSGATLIDPGK